MKVMIIVPINTNEHNKDVKNAAEKAKSPDMHIDITNLEKGTPYIESRTDLAVNAPYVVEKAIQIQKQGYDGIFVSDMDFCGVEASRENINIPIIGGFRASAFTAMMISQKFSIVTVVNKVVDMQREHILAFGLESNFASIRSIDTSVPGLSNTETVVQKAYETSVKCIEEDSADSIIFGCTGFINVAEPVQKLLKETGYPAQVIDPNMAAISYLELLIRNKLSQSRLTYYPK